MKLCWCRRYLSSSSVIADMDTESVYSKLDKNIKKALLDTFGETEGPFESFLFASKVSIGDYQSTVALNLSKKLKIPPKEIANRLISSLSNIPEIKSVDISGAGFINLYLADHFVNERLKKKLLDKERVGIPTVANPQKVVVDFSSPNIAKEMHVVSLYPSPGYFLDS
jgi:arginyl-tRNA synthetase